MAKEVYEVKKGIDEGTIGILEVRAELAKENVNSIAHRYGHHAGDDGDAKDVLFSDGYTHKDYYKEVSNAESVKYKTEEAVLYLHCLDYQSCEHPEWKESTANKWITEALASLAYDLAKHKLGDSRVWEVSTSS